MSVTVHRIMRLAEAGARGYHLTASIRCILWEQTTQTSPAEVPGCEAGSVHSDKSLLPVLTEMPRGEQETTFLALIKESFLEGRQSRARKRFRCESSVDVTLPGSLWQL